MIQPKKLKGFRDYDPREMQLRSRIGETLRHHALLAGFGEISTPALEYAEVLLGSGGEEADKEVYRFEDHGGRQVALRFDLTVPFARYVAENQGTMVLPFRRLQMGAVWRGEKPQKGRYREFAQADLDIIGVDSAFADVEVLTCLVLAIKDLVPSSFRVSIGNRVLLSKIIESIVCNDSLEPQVLIALDKLEKIGEGKVIAILEQLGISTLASKRLLEVLAPKADGQSDLSAIASLWPDDDPIHQELDRLTSTVKLAQELVETDRCRMVIDLRIARGLGYYTGIVFETTLDELPGFGSISSGGRYNKLLSRFTTRELPGVGGSIGVDRLLAALMELEAGSSQTVARHGVFVALGDLSFAANAFQLTNALRRRGLRCETDLKGAKLAQQFRLADRLGYKHVVVLGASEVATGRFTCKNLQSGEEKKDLNRNELFLLLGCEP